MVADVVHVGMTPPKSVKVGGDETRNQADWCGQKHLRNERKYQVQNHSDSFPYEK